MASSVSSATFDITLLLILLRNICYLKPPVTGWGNLPSEEDKSLEADIVRIKYFRNTVYALAAQASVNDATFNTHWQKIRAVLVRLGGAKYEEPIDILKTECMDPDIEEHYKELLQQWKKDEYVIKEQLHEMGEDIKYMKEALRVALSRHRDEEVHPGMMHPDKSLSHRGELPEMYGSTSGQESNKINTREKYSGQHTFTKLTDDKILPRKSGDSKAYCSQESANTNEACGVGETDWCCSRCTYLNHQKYRICLVCGATRGIGDVESTKPGSKVCRNCTLHNEETATVCKACYESLSKSDAVV